MPLTKWTTIVGMTAAIWMFVGVLLTLAATYGDDELARLFAFGFYLTISAMSVCIAVIFFELLGQVFWPHRVR